ncbi:hypothetical protein BC351_10460 [Paenibacillus ferrarius]|uniref:ParB-like N-terminal domain-containing protein n=1 Tax=Paenibacillus ferrarius TaxID=1469647 RepID=A0A1V4H8R1_9BACL|nr:ParB N-terminal domain-containing protein [Paenibacillus ferrarius]OPH47605.1 hypothetical protein BC351_10460 [Paenibacillus ferrarius]
MIQIEKLNPHPKNEYYFTDVVGDKYEEIKRSINTYGIRDPLKVTTAYTIISGHQRYRIARDLGLSEVPVEIVDVDEWKAEYMLIAENTERRGEAEGDPIKKARIIQFLKDYWNIKKGSRSDLGPKVRSSKEMADYIGEDERTTRRLAKLNELIPQLQSLVSSGKFSVRAAEQLAYLTEEEQEVLFEERGEAISEMTLDESKKLRKENEQLKKQLLNSKDTETKIANALEDKRTLELELINLKNEKTKTEFITNNIMVDKPETLDKITRLEEQIKEKEGYVEKYRKSLKELNEKNAIINKFMGENTNFQLVSKASEVTLKMLDFTKEMSRYDYLSEVFNEIPDATRKEYVRSIYGVYKWARNILQEVKHDDVIGVNKNIIDVKKTNVEVI